MTLWGISKKSGSVLGGQILSSSGLKRSWGRPQDNDLLGLLEDSSELLEVSELLVIQSELPVSLQVKAVGSAPLAKSEPPVDEAVEEAIAAPKSQYLNRQQLGKYFGKSHETIRQWEADGKLAEKGWEVVPRSGSSPKNPRLYRPIPQ